MDAKRERIWQDVRTSRRQEGTSQKRPWEKLHSLPCSSPAAVGGQREAGNQPLSGAKAQDGARRSQGVVNTRTGAS